MARPLVVSIPHQLGKEEAARRLKSGFGRARSTFGEKLAVIDETWSGDHLDFRAGVLGQTTTGTIDVVHRTPGSPDAGEEIGGMIQGS